jgi:hypothetical protein
MEVTREEDRAIFIMGSKETINRYIEKNDCRSALRFFVLILSRLDNDEKKEFIEYYSKNMKKLGL